MPVFVTVSGRRGFGKHTHEQIVGIWNITSHLEELFQVVELTVDVTTYLSNRVTTCEEDEARLPSLGSNGVQRLSHRDRGIHTLNITFLHKYLTSFSTERLHFRFFDVFAPPELLDLTVKVTHASGREGSGGLQLQTQNQAGCRTAAGRPVGCTAVATLG